MIKHKDHFHGSDLEKIEQIYGIKKEAITSFSANVNPLGISPLLKKTLCDHIDIIQTYPDRDYQALRKSIATYTGADSDNIIVGNGSTELISLFIELEQPKKAMILGPTYSEYERSISLSGGSSVYYALKETDDFHLNTSDLTARLHDDLDLLIICNPNNPTSSAICSQDMRKILDCCMEHGIFVMIDETYIEFADNVSAFSAVSLTNDYNNLIVLRGVSKFFAAPGLRLGYAITGNRDLISKFNSRSNPWTINSLAALAGEIMFSDKEYIERTRSLISSESARLYTALNTSSRYKVYKPAANFMLVRLLDEEMTSDQLFDRCIRKGLMIRDCSTFPFLDNHYIRFCIMSPEKNNELLSQFL